jgi:hypothetical protein
MSSKCVAVSPLFALISTGFWIHDPFTGWSLHSVRNVHLFAAFLLVLLAGRQGHLPHALTILRERIGGRRQRQVHQGLALLLPSEGGQGAFWEIAKYYLRLRKAHPCTAKHDPLQKLVYGALMFWKEKMPVRMECIDALQRPEESADPPAEKPAGAASGESGVSRRGQRRSRWRDLRSSRRLAPTCGSRRTSSPVSPSPSP